MARAFDGLVIMTIGNALQLFCKVVEGADGMGHDEAAEEQDEHQTDDEEGRDDVGQEVVAAEEGALGSDEGKTPVGVWHRLITDDAGHALDPDAHTALLPGSHLMPQSDDIGILVGIGTGEDGFREKLCGVGMQIETSFVAYHEEIGIGKGGLGSEGLRQAQQRDIGGDDAQ